MPTMWSKGIQHQCDLCISVFFCTLCHRIEARVTNCGIHGADREASSNGSDLGSQSKV